MRTLPGSAAANARARRLAPSSGRCTSPPIQNPSGCSSAGGSLSPAPSALHLVRRHGEPLADCRARLAAGGQDGPDRLLPRRIAPARLAEPAEPFFVAQQRPALAPTDDQLTRADVLLQARMGAALIAHFDVPAPTHPGQELHLDQRGTLPAYLAIRVEVAYDEIGRVHGCCVTPLLRAASAQRSLSARAASDYRARRSSQGTRDVAISRRHRGVCAGRRRVAMLIQHIQLEDEGWERPPGVRPRICGFPDRTPRRCAGSPQHVGLGGRLRHLDAPAHWRRSPSLLTMHNGTRAS
jgi:hypothetical protein